MFGLYKFKRHGNEAQYRGNVQVLSKLKEADNHLDSNNITFENVTSARDKIQEGINLLNDREKLIKIADSSPMGWKVVTEYQANPIADNSDDEKKIHKAQTRAEKKAKEAHIARRARALPHPYTRSYTYPVPGSQKPSYTQNEPSPPVNRPGTCFKCGMKGHWIRECKKQDTDEKMSTNFSVCSVNFDPKSSVSGIKVHSCDLIELNSNSLTANDNASITCTKPSPVGRLKSCLNIWVKTSANAHTIDVIQSGYKQPFRTSPPSVYLRNNKSALENPVFVQQEINELVRKGCVSEVANQPNVVNPLTVAFNKVN
ncbi:hypothetical protein FSP39_010930 [Pinctada imbricata]|uniref:CCHC-type domain-containing protein n=1 Tax=Pinctada imbricata TaxID=66713 RepID=A0AA88XIF7_PINIB|nr:hypothetical protein FSP39_010930 [Pinctada imbricata]